MEQYRVWPDGTVQLAEDTPYSWMSDDYTLVQADDDEHAWQVYNETSRY